MCYRLQESKKIKKNTINYINKFKKLKASETNICVFIASYCPDQGLEMFYIFSIFVHYEKKF